MLNEMLLSLQVRSSSPSHWSPTTVTSWSSIPTATNACIPKETLLPWYSAHGSFPVICLLPALMEMWGKFGYVAMLVTCNLLLDHRSQSYKFFPVSCARWNSMRSDNLLLCEDIPHNSHKPRQMRSTQAQQSLTMEKRIHKKEMHLTKMMVTIFVVFILSYFPCTITGIIDWNTILSKQFHMFCTISVYIGSALNPVIYGVMNTQFRNAYLRLLCCKKIWPTKTERLKIQRANCIEDSHRISKYERVKDTENQHLNVLVDNTRLPSIDDGRGDGCGLLSVFKQSSDGTLDHIGTGATKIESSLYDSLPDINTECQIVVTVDDTKTDISG